MALEVYEVDDRPGVRRLDHPDAQDVFRTSYKKGVITDFKKTDDDPLRVDAMVKVQVEGYAESDYIPIFYTPKAQYWDDAAQDILATDFDEDNKYYKQAWMSFRGGDEVVVALQAPANENQLEPKYVVGFIDNYPRIGENYIKIVYQTCRYIYFWQRYGDSDANVTIEPYENFFYLQIHTPEYTDSVVYNPLRYIVDEEYNVKKQGPDDSELGLLTEVEPITDESLYVVITDTAEWVYGGSAYTVEKDYRWYKFTEFLVVVGPLLLSIQFVWQKYYTYYSFDAAIDPPPAIREDLSGYTKGIYVSGAIYTQELYDEVKSISEGDSRTPQERFLSSTTTGQFNVYDGFEEYGLLENSLTYKEIDGLSLTYWPWKENAEYTSPPDETTEPSADWSTARFYIRPHTKQELIDAGFLNADDTLPEV